MNTSIQNYVSGNFVKANTTRSNRVKKMLKRKNKTTNLVKPSVANRFFNLFSNKKPIPVGTLKRRPAGGAKLTEYQLRALNELSHRSMNTIQTNLKTLKNKKNSKILSKALNMTKRKN